MPLGTRKLRQAALTLAPVALLLALCAAASGQNGSNDAPWTGRIAREDVDACMDCHASRIGGLEAVNAAALSLSPHKDLKCQDCHTTITAAPHTPEMLRRKAACRSCHEAEGAAFARSVHARPDKVAGDHPTCAGCHARGADPHVVHPLQWSRVDKVEICSHCHRQSWRMYRAGTNGGVDTDAVSSYEDSFHGKALLRFGNTKVAICTDCHKHHDVLAPEDPASPTNRANAAATCAQQGCHPGAQVNFAMSGSNHLRLKLKQSPVLKLELLFFRCLVFGVIAGMLTVIALDLRRKVFGRAHPPRAGRAVGLLISLAFIFIVLTLGLATLELPGIPWTFLAALLLSAAAFVVYVAEGRPGREDSGEKHYHRLSLTLRIHHLLLVLSFTTLAVTGLPMRFASMEAVPKVYVLFGGFDGARIAHRVAAVVMLVTFVWHVLYLLYRWHKAGYTLKSWTMLPNLKDLQDAIAAGKYYLHLSHEEPKFGRFQFREKLDYLAEYWGVPLMVVTGFILWFPIYWGNRLPEVGLSFAYIAHSYEATLAFLAIVTWHMYNAHFNPDVFPMSRSWLTGKLSRSEMEREHPLELEWLERAESGARPGRLGRPAPAPSPTPEAAESTASPEAPPEAAGPAASPEAPPEAPPQEPETKE